MDWQLVYLGQFYLKVRIAPRYRKTFKPMIWRLKSATDLWHLHDKKNPYGKTLLWKYLPSTPLLPFMNSQFLLSLGLGCLSYLCI